MANDLWPVQQPGVSSGAGRWQRHWQKFIALACWLLLLAGYQLYAWQSDLTPLAAATAIITFVATSAWGPLLYILLYTLRPLVLFPATVLSIGGGLLFGPVLGVIYTIIGSNLSATVAYLIGRFLGQGLLQPDAAQGAGAAQGLVQRYAERMRAHSFVTILTMRFVLLPYDLVNYLAGLLRIDYRAFLLATVLGSIPGTIAFVLAGAAGYAAGERNFSGGLPRFDPRVFAASAVIFVLSLVIAQVIKRREQRAEHQTG